MSIYRTALLSGFVGGLMFCVGWMVDVGVAPTLIVALVAGMSSVLAQTASRELSAKAQSLIDRAIEQVVVDGGEAVEHARATRLRVVRLGLAAMLFGVIAPTFATIRTILPQAVWSAAAWGAASIAVTVSILLFVANQELALILEQDKIARAVAKPALDALEKRKEIDASTFKGDPNFGGFEVHREGS